MRSSLSKHIFFEVFRVKIGLDIIVCSFLLTLFPVFEHHLESSHCCCGDQNDVSFGMCPSGMMHVFLSDQHCSVDPSHMANGSGVGRTDGWTTARVNENWDVAWPIFSEKTSAPCSLGRPSGHECC